MTPEKVAGRLRRVAGALLAGVVLAAGCTGEGGAPGPDRPTTVVSRPGGGTARVGVWAEPNPDALTLGGAAVRSLVLPQLFVAGPDGRWAPSLVLPDSDTTAPDRRSATFRLRPGAVWSDGSPITAEDLRRTADTRFVAGVDGPSVDGVITVRFTQALPGWRRLWSGTEVVRPAQPGVWGGPFVLASYTPGLEAVLRPNEQWYGGRANLDEVRLVLVPDSTVARQLLARGDLDVVMPPATTNRTPRLESVAGVEVSVGRPGGWWVGLVLRAGGLTAPQRAALVGSVDRLAFVSTLLRDEAAQLDGLSPATAGRAGAWSGLGAGSSSELKGVTVDLVGQVEDPMAAALERSMQKRAHPAGARLDLRNAEADRVEGWVAEGSYQAAIVSMYDSPAVCWTCRWAGFDEAAARAADAGEPGAVEALERRLKSESLVLPLWRPIPVVAWRSGLAGVEANGYALSAAWNAWQWFRPAK